MASRLSAVYIPAPCAESWDAMTPASSGRHCASCQKTVIDFTQKTDAEILAALRQAAGKTCGRLRADQLNRLLVVPAPAPRWRAWLGAAVALGGVLGAGRVAAQAHGSQHIGLRPATTGPASHAVPTAPSPSLTTTKLPTTPETVPSGPLLVRGVVQDATTCEGLPGATVLVKGTNIGVSTDATGAFELPLAVGKAPLVLTFSSIGYIGQESLLPPGSSQPLAIPLAADVKGLMGEVVVVGGIWRKPWPWHPRRFFNWGKYWVSKPFRE